MLDLGPRRGLFTTGQLFTGRAAHDPIFGERRTWVHRTQAAGGLHFRSGR